MLNSYLLKACSQLAIMCPTNGLSGPLGQCRTERLFSLVYVQEANCVPYISTYRYFAQNRETARAKTFTEKQMGNTITQIEIILRIPTS